MLTSIMRRHSFGAIDPVASRMWDWFATPTGYTPLSKIFGEANAFVPPVDIYDTAEDVVVVASLPGLDINKVDIQVREDELTLSGEQLPVPCFDTDEKVAPVFNGIPRYGKFSFALRLPSVVDAGQTQAKYEHGLLCMRFLKAQSARPVRISVQTDGQQRIAESKPDLPETK